MMPAWKQEQNTFLFENCRVSVLTESLVRLEYAPDGIFADGETQRVRSRDFPIPAPEVAFHGTLLQLQTSHLRLTWDLSRPTLTGVTIRLRGNYSTYHSTWRWGEHPQTLGGTAPTLDKADGEIPLEEGILSRYGLALLDDSESPLLCGGDYLPRPADTRDIYFFGYGHRYRDALKDYFLLTGIPPLIPRFALGNWWSRFYPYTQESYLTLMDTFAEKGIPFSVAVLDMDWHITQPPRDQGSGWTGYTWNRQRFPHPEALLQALHDRGLAVTVNLHPAEGIRPFEEDYPTLAPLAGLHPEDAIPLDFDLQDSGFMAAYLALHRKLEAQGVDFFWVDWQQGNVSNPGQPETLWLLNRLHWQESARNQRRGLILSRYAGPGSQRYPIGFSGDTWATWDSLRFQPRFTATASNIGFCWWSHDIGGHMHGSFDEELMIRWVQFGVFSPIHRLHSSNNEFSGKEPWRYGPAAEAILTRFLRLRHCLIPCLSNLNIRLTREGRAPMEPLYYAWPEEKEAYAFPNEYLLGDDLLVCPITEPMEHACGGAEVTVWLPEGEWIDFFTGQRYRGGRKMKLVRPLDTLPVLARAGAIIPLEREDAVSSSTANPEHMHLRIFSGADGSCTLYEDDGTDDGAVETEIIYKEKTGDLMLHAPQGICSSLPEARDWLIEFIGMEAEGAMVDGVEIDLTKTDSGILLSIPSASSVLAHHVSFSGLRPRSADPGNRVRAVLARAHIPYDLKAEIDQICGQPRAVFSLLALPLSPMLLAALTEALDEGQSDPDLPPLG